MTRVYGGCIEPGGMALDDLSQVDACPECERPAHYRYWEACEAGAINGYSSISCDHCGFVDGDEPDDP